MVDFPKFINLGGKEKKLPMHLALSTGPLKAWAEDKKKDLKEAADQHFSLLNDLLDYQLKNQIRVLTINLVDSSPELVNGLKDFFISLCKDERINKNQMRVFIIGQWYEIDPDLSEALKLCMETTKHYDNFFLNVCLNYSGRDEVLGSLRLMARKVFSGKMLEGELSEDLVKENLYSSYFPPPDLIIECTNTYSGLLLWDAKGAVIYFSPKKWPLLEKRDLDEAIAFYDRNINKDE